MKAEPTLDEALDFLEEQIRCIKNSPAPWHVEDVRMFKHISAKLAESKITEAK